MSALTPLLATLLFASPAFLSPLPEVEDIRVVYRWDFESNQHGIAAHDMAGSMLGVSCSKALDSGVFAAQPISVDVTHDENAVDGSISVDGAAHPLAWDDSDDKPKCSLAWGSSWAEADCQVLGSFRKDGSAVDLTFDDCFRSSVESESLLSGVSLADTSNSTSEEALNGTVAAAKKRDTNASIKRDTIVVDKAHPMQEAYHKQLSQNHHCVNGKCAASISQSRTSTWQFMAEIQPVRWINGGFAVQKSKSTSEGHTCKGNPGDTVCVWHNEKYTSYLVQNTETVCSRFGCGPESKSDPFRILSPNRFQHVSSGYYCVKNNCRSKGQAYVQKLGNGGPPTS